MTGLLVVIIGIITLLAGVQEGDGKNEGSALFLVIGGFVLIFFGSIMLLRGI